MAVSPATQHQRTNDSLTPFHVPIFAWYCCLATRPILCFFFFIFSSFMFFSFAFTTFVMFSLCHEISGIMCLSMGCCSHAHYGSLFFCLSLLLIVVAMRSLRFNMLDICRQFGCRFTPSGDDNATRWFAGSYSSPRSSGQPFCPFTKMSSIFILFFFVVSMPNVTPTKKNSIVIYRIRSDNFPVRDVVSDYPSCWFVGYWHIDNVNPRKKTK